MALNSIADTSQGRMVGDYISTSIVGGKAWPTFMVSNPPSGNTFDEAANVPTGGLDITGGTISSKAKAVVTHGFQPHPTVPPTAR